MNSIDDLDFSKTYSYADYYSWRFDERLELIHGKVSKMVNYPGATCMGTNHQTILGNIVCGLYNFIKKTNIARVYAAPFDVRFIDKSSYDEDVSNLVQPDVSVFLDRAKLDERGGIGSPDIVVEILKTGNNVTEIKHKFQLYEDFGVAEYWMIFPGEQCLLSYKFDNNGKYTAGRPLTNGDTLRTPVLPGFELVMDDVFHDLLRREDL